MERHGVEEQAVVVEVKGCDSSYLELAVPCGMYIYVCMYRDFAHARAAKTERERGGGGGKL